MKQEEKKYIVQQRVNGASFVQIGRDLGRSEDAVRVAFNRIMAEGRKTSQKEESRTEARDGLLKCKYCGMPFRKNAGSSRRLFCSDKCRNAWANEKKRRIPYSRICEHCGLSFVAFGNPNKRFCGRKCYEDSRKQSDGDPATMPGIDCLAADRPAVKEISGGEQEDARCLALWQHWKGDIV